MRVPAAEVIGKAVVGPDKADLNLDVVRGRRPNPCPGIEALEALRVAVACDRSLAEGRPVALEEVGDDAD